MPHLPERLEFSINEEEAFELPGLGTAGYLWEHEILGDGDVVEVQWVRGHASGAGPAPVGVSAPEVLRIRARRSGRVILRVYQHRRWDPPDLALHEHRISILVRGE